jgi:acetoin utilization protein AcuB
MLVVNWMSTKLVGLGPDDSLAQAMRLMKENQIEHLPVIKDNKLVGIVSDRDVKRASASDATSLEVHELSYLLTRVKVKDFMSPDPVTVHVHDSIEDAALLMLENKISALPVLDDSKKVVAMLTQMDLFRALVLLSGVIHGGVQFAVDLPDVPGSIKAPADIIRKHGGKIVSIFTSYERVAPGRRLSYFRVKDLKPEDLEKVQKEMAAVGEPIYVLDTDAKKLNLLAPHKLASLPEK